MKKEIKRRRGIIRDTIFTQTLTMSNSILHVNTSHSILFMNILHIFYPPPSSYFRFSDTKTSLVKLVHFGSCCKLEKQATATLGFKKMDDSHKLF